MSAPPASRIIAAPSFMSHSCCRPRPHMKEKLKLGEEHQTMIQRNIAKLLQVVCSRSFLAEHTSLKIVKHQVHTYLI